MVERDGILVTDEIPNVRLEQPLGPSDLARVKRVRWQWVLTFNRARAMPRSPASDEAMARCEEAIAIIDGILAAQPTILRDR